MNTFNHSLLKKKNNLPYFEIPAIATLGWIEHGFLTRRGGISLPPYDSLNLSDDHGDRNDLVSQNRCRISTAFRFDPDHLILLNQNHHDKILVVREPHPALSPPLEYDALITNASETFLGIRTADCLPILIADPGKRVIAAVHAGRQGTALHITATVIRKMGAEFGCDPQNLFVAMGPAIGPCCYEIDEKVFLPEWKPFALPRGGGKWMLDLGRANRAQIEGEGIRKEQIFWINRCTCCDDGLFFSYRREGRTGRQLSFIGIV